MSYARIAAKVYSSLWALEPSTLASLLSVLHSRMAGELASPEVLGSLPSRTLAERFSVTNTIGTNLAHDDNPDLDGSDEPEPVKAEKMSGTVVIFGSGILGKHLSSMEEMCAGGLSIDRLQAALSTAAAAPAVENIVLHLDSPGGVVQGIPETADLIAKIRETKNVVAYIDSLCASAGYWIAAACDHVYLTRSAKVGSIGVYSALLDVTGYYAKEGIKVELFKDGVHKAAGFPGTSLTDAQRAEIQASVLACSASFKADVRRFRGDIADDVMQGQCFDGQAAIDAGLADSLVGGLADVLADLTALSSAKRAS